ncbi:carboxypeptidase-like regulatory domain-containing protein [Archangium sp.]|uniref:MSCRAMM family protein n=1 Tax=Archangium sp. TaxID=1872627 RepID=UPI00286CE661|nr:carboxypeptidase-like regulatory domain-containing protein [Archangium sp.]
MGRRAGIFIGAVLLVAALWYSYSEAPLEWAPSRHGPVPSEASATVRSDGAPGTTREGFSLWGLLSGSEEGRGHAQGGWLVWPSGGWGSRGPFGLERACWLSGRVTDEEGQPLPGATVQVSDSGGRPLVRTFEEAQTDAEGRYRVGPFAPGLYTVFADGEGYVGTQLPAHPITSDSETLDFTLRHAVPLEGTVVDEDGQPVGGVSLFLLGPGAEGREARPPPLTFTESREDGTFHLDAPEPGTYSVRLGHTHYLETERDVTAPVRGARLVLRSGAAVELEVVDEAERPVANAEVHVLPEVIQGPYHDKTALTDERGQVTVKGLQAGRYGVAAAMPESTPLRTVRRVVELRDSERQRVRLRFEEGPRLSGVVVDQAGKPVAGAEVRVAPAFLVDPRKYAAPELEPYSERLDAAWFSGSERTNRTGPDGRFTVPHLHSGPYLVTALKDGYDFDSRATGGARRVLGPLSGVLVSAGTSDVRLVLESLGYVRGRVVRVDGSPVTHFQLNGLGQEDEQGAFQWPIHDTGELVLAFAASGLAGTVRKVQGRVGEDVELGAVVLGPGRQVRVRVVDAATSEPVFGATVDLRAPGAADPEDERSLLYGISEVRTGPDGTTVYEARPDPRTDADGTRVLENVEARPLLVLVSHPEYLRAGVPLGATARELTVPLGSGTWVRGEVRAGETLMDRGWVKLSTPGGEETDLASIEQGMYSLGPVKAGRYIAQVQSVQFEEEKSPVFLPREVVVPESGGTVTLDFEAQRNGTSVEVLTTEEVAEVILVPGTQPLPGPRGETYKRFIFGHRTEADPEGRFRLRMLPAGRYTLFAVRDWDALELEVHREEVDVPPRETVSFTVRPRWRTLASPPSE